MYMAVFIGGPFDMTKRAVEHRRRDIYFYEPVKPVLALDQATEEAVACRKLRYEFEHVARDGALIYSYAGYEPQ
ncbi:hypothetical protein [Marinobacterium sp. MBR-109]|jgi:hypothetical protein|uniref:hypothetical protein n=1 Tax=Marinobacterium sp. MBR-109 TaxID=3156462 RepID=UPI0033993665